jgi:hypothetical protein
MADETSHGSADAHGNKDDAHGHDAHDAHGHDDHAGHETLAEFVKEDSTQDKLLQLVTALAGAGLIFMMGIWWSTPLPAEHAAPKVPELQDGSTIK